MSSSSDMGPPNISGANPAMICSGVPSSSIRTSALTPTSLNRKTGATTTNKLPSGPAYRKSICSICVRVKWIYFSHTTRRRKYLSLTSKEEKNTTMKKKIGNNTVFLEHSTPYSRRIFTSVPPKSAIETGVSSHPAGKLKEYRLTSDHPTPWPPLFPSGRW